MYLKRLEINGFKSFAQKTVLDFLPPNSAGQYSTTAIVGPNGSGKSNITDAIRWVMGETSLKNIRGKKSEDVIFGGSDAKGALSAAEVSMTLDNDGRIPDMDYSEIIITRRLYRSGETEYLINNHPVRLLDIHLLLAQAQFAEGAYSIVSQGMIDRLLTVTPSERKDFFDEASGIKEFQIKRHQAALKLARTEDNIAQADVVMKEIEPRLKLLSKQVKKLEQRELLASELTLAQERFYATLATQQSQEKLRLTQLVADAEERYRAMFAELTEVQTELSRLAKAASRQEQFDALQAEQAKALQVMNEIERQLMMLEGQLHTEYREAGQHTLAWLSSKQAEHQAALATLEQTLVALRAAATETAGAVTEQQAALARLEKQKTERLVTISRLENTLLRGESEQQYRELTGLTAIKAVLEARNQFGMIYGLLGELGQVDEQYRLALEVAAAQHLSSLVVKDEQVARLAIEYLRAQRLGVATFLPQSTIRGRWLSVDEQRLLGEEGVIGRALDLVRFDQQFQEIFAFVLGSTIVIEDLTVAERLGFGRARLVTLAGDVVEKNGVLKGGFRARNNQIGFSMRSSLGASANMEQARADLGREKEALRTLEAEYAGLTMRRREAEDKARAADTELKITERQVEHQHAEAAGVAHELSLLTASPEEHTEQLARLATEKDALTAKKQAQEVLVSKAGEKIARFNEEEELKKQRVFELQEAMQAKQFAVNTVLAERNDIKVELAKIETKQESLGQECWNDIKISLPSLLERNVALLAEGEIPAVLSTIEKLRYQLSLIGGIDTEVVAEYKTTKERFDFLDGQLSDLTKALTNLTELIAELDEIMKKKRASAFKKIRQEFGRYFKILFEGGSADLQEVYGEPPAEGEEAAEGAMPPQLETTAELPAEADTPKKSAKDKILTGIEVIASPPGKKIKYLNALSGGERTLTSIALICAILHHNPSPFVVLDEVEAALDEANTQRFVRIMGELSKQSQFIIVTHNRVTMHAMDALYGVVMNNDGMSRLFSVKITEAEQMAEMTVPVDKSA